MPARQCYHCKQWIEAGEAHDCWTTTEEALTADLSEDLREAWERLRETAAEFGPQRIYASHKSIMFARRSCYCFVRPKKSFLELCVFLDSPITAPQVRRVVRASASRLVHIIPIRHRDEVEAPITEWLHRAYDLNGEAPSRDAPHAPMRRSAQKRADGKTTGRKTAVRRVARKKPPTKRPR
jgi:Domain of unknown function (DUF5655)